MVMPQAPSRGAGASQLRILAATSFRVAVLIWDRRRDERAERLFSACAMAAPEASSTRTLTFWVTSSTGRTQTGPATPGTLTHVAGSWSPDSVCEATSTVAPAGAPSRARWQ